MTKSIHHISDSSAYALWQCSDSTSELAQRYDGELPERFASFHTHKQAEFLSSRLLLKDLCLHMGIPFHGVWKDEHGKPHLKNSTWHISISHTYPYVACMIHPSDPCGIDIETPRQQLQRISRKFLSADELLQTGNDLLQLCIYWCAKEAMYKLYGRKKLHFADQIHIKPKEGNLLVGNISTPEYSFSTPLQYYQHEQLIVVCSC